jgi:hypothetical protein
MNSRTPIRINARVVAGCREIIIFYDGEISFFAILLSPMRSTNNLAGLELSG